MLEENIRWANQNIFEIESKLRKLLEAEGHVDFNLKDPVTGENIPISVPTIPEMLKAVGGKVKSITDFGAKGDADYRTGEGTDCSQAFKDAMDYCFENKCALYIPKGAYKITEPIYIKAPFIFGEGREHFRPCR